MFCIVEQAGYQFKVSEGDKLNIPLTDAPIDSEITLGRVLLVTDGDKTTVGTPVVSGITVKAKVLGNGKADKILVIKKHRRKDYKRKNGHRQPFTTIQITSIAA